jgi:hypothetical protein
MFPSDGSKRLTMTVILAALLILFARSETQEASQLYQGVPLDARLIKLDRAALDDAYHAQLVHLFSVWLKDDISSTSRVSNGLRIARRAYSEAATQIDQREKQVQP